MTKKELIQSAKLEAGLDAQKMEKALNAILGKVGDELSKGGQVVLKGFGSFKVTAQAARTGRNPQTGAPINIPAKRKIKFTPSTTLKEKVNS